MILDETYSLLKTRYSSLIKSLTISDVRIGLYLTAVKLSDGSSGVASTIKDGALHCVKEKRDFNDFTPTQIAGKRVIDLFETPKNTGIVNSLRIAVLNAISSTFISNGKYKVIENSDPIELVDLTPRKTITIVGAFQSYIQKISATDNQLFVLELDENALIDGHKKHFVPAEEYSKIVPISDVVIITGLTLINNTIDGLLSAISPHTQLVVTGPSSSLIPDILFQNKVNIVGGTQITNPDVLFDLVSESGTGYHLFKYCAQKICILNVSESQIE